MNSPLAPSTTPAAPGAAPLSYRVRHHAWIMAVAAVIGAVWAYVVVIREPVEYVSSARMFISGRVNLPDSSSTYSEEFANYFGTQAEIMRSQEVNTRATQRVQLDQPGIQGGARLEVRVLPNTSIFLLSATGDRPDYARAFLNATMAEFTKFKRERRLMSSQTTIEQISAELARLDKEINVQEQATLDFKERNNITYWEQQSVSSARLLTDLKTREAALRMQLSVMDTWERMAAERGLTDTADIDESGAVATAKNPELGQAQQKLDLLTVERDELLQGLRPVHPKVVRLNADIAQLTKVIALAAGKAREHRKERRAAMQSELDGLAKGIAECEAKATESSRIGAEYQKIRNALERTHNLYNGMLTSLQNLDTRKSVDQELVQILQVASPAFPVNKKIAARTMSGLMWGAFIGFGVLMLVLRLDDRSFSVEGSVDRLGSRSLAEVPQRDARPSTSGRSRFVQSAFEESFRRLSSFSLLGLPAGKPSVFLVTSTFPAEGKSEIAINLARTFGRMGRRVLLVDADLHRGRLHRTLNAGDIGPGFQELLRGEATEDQVIRTTSEPNLSLITSGVTTIQAGEVLSSDSLASRIESLSRRFDIVVFDTAPTGPVDDTHHLVPFASRVLFVIRMRHTSLRRADKALTILKARGVQDVGLVFNRVRQEGDRRYYSYYKS